ncbi:MAG: 4Fe-4S dicluster domain-containing protein [Lachnospiraceae bacterium]|nr:4Fe-4S dicluster domain-containing protein [Lachnospiraceae bacterium]
MEQDFVTNSKKFGFGCMRLPMKDGNIDFEECNRMVDAFMEAGFTYFDTAKGYLGGLSEVAVRECVVKRYPRESFTLTDKLTMNFFNRESDIRKVFEEQLETCGVSYFDYYLMHAQGKVNYEKYKKCRAYEVAQELKAEGKIKHVGLSFHDNAEYLDRILTEHPEVELVQIQLNYVDYDDPGVQSRKCLEVCEKHHKPVVVMEPVKGGSLVNLPAEADHILKDLNSGNAAIKYSNAGLAIRFAASCKQVFMVLSGMSSLEQMQDNIGTMKDFEPLNAAEYAAIEKVCEIFKAQNLIPCTACRYCVDGCPKQLLIPDLFADMNAKKQHHDWNSDYYYNQVHTQGHGKASDCIKCGKCEKSCPQHLEIRTLLEQVAGVFEK